MAVDRSRQDREVSDYEKETPSNSIKVKPIRLRPALYEAAVRYADIEHRSVPRQIEFWAEIGRWFAGKMDLKTIYALLAGTATMDIKHPPSATLSPDALIDALAEAKKAGGFDSHLAGSNVIYDTDPEHPARIRRTEQSTGATAYGEFVNGEFVVDDGPDQAARAP